MIYDLLGSSCPVFLLNLIQIGNLVFSGSTLKACDMFNNNEVNISKSCVMALLKKSVQWGVGVYMGFFLTGLPASFNLKKKTNKGFNL